MSMKPLPMPEAWAPFLDEWAGYLRSAGAPPATVKQRTYWAGRLARDLDGTDPWKVEAREVARWAGAHDWARDTRRSAYAGVRGFYEWAIAMGYIEVSPARALPFVRQSEPAPKPCPDEAYEQALVLADPAEQIMLRLAAEVGLRRGEIARIHATDLIDDLTGVSLYVHGKGGKTRIIPLPEGLGGAVRARAGKGYLFPARFGDGHITPGAVGKKLARLLGDYSAHSLRHRFATRAYGASSDLLAVQRLLGHASPATTQRYVLLDSDRLRAAMESAA